MKREINKYDIWDITTKTKILSNVSSTQAQRYIGGKFSVCTYAKQQIVKLDKYLFTYTGCEPDFPQEKKARKTSEQREVQKLLNAEWDKVCKPFRNVEWVKNIASGVKILEAVR